MGRGDQLKPFVVKIQRDTMELVSLEEWREDRNNTISLNADTGRGGASVICQQEQKFLAE